ncbi:alpha/beta fold hydrolase [Oceanibacterium hippocampi]|uniref:2-hydroxymuconate semialdehyde hydrolase n=1 Tax=Oceanibacterium hippocampi TaxID=745714 RepID=A0A1Y5TKP4_9PROT|nr:alpha/beta fold hydrolase [Oceanibacterium hippocampi]SLN64298.1 2-hydroxymuconate semialdehyde hydrolase [Oceanibacterium hippocampi]
MICYPIAVGPVVTRLFVAGTEGPPVFLIHGLTSRADRLKATAEKIAAQGYQVYVPDMPGHGFATKNPAHGQSIGGYRDFVLGLMDVLGIEKAVLIGTSVGGHVVGALACAHPERVTALTMIGSLGFYPIPPERPVAVKAGIADMSLEAMRSRLLRVFTDPKFVTDELVLEDVKVNTSPGAVDSLNAFADYMAAGYNDDLVLDGLAKLQGRFPLLLIWGEDDKSVSVEEGRKARAVLTKADLVVLSNVNHTPYIERPDWFEPIILDFLAGHTRRFQAPGVTWS